MTLKEAQQVARLGRVHYGLNTIVLVGKTEYEVDIPGESRTDTITKLRELNNKIKEAEDGEFILLEDLL